MYNMYRNVLYLTNTIAIFLFIGDIPIHLFLSSRSVENLEAVATKCRALSPESVVAVIPLDLSDLTEEEGGSLDRYMTALHKHLKGHSLGGIDCLIGNAGVSSRGSALDTSEAVLRSVMNVNFFGPVALTKAIARDMCARNTGGAIAVVSSVQGKLGLPLRTSYACSKHALQGYFDSVRGELSLSGVNVSVISPGYISTNLSLNAVTAAGEQYGVTDETTRNGMTPATAAHMTLLAIANEVPDLILADDKTVAAIQGKTQFPDLMAKFMNKRAKQYMT